MVATCFWWAVATLVQVLGQSSDSRFSRLPPKAQFRLVGGLLLVAIGGIALVTLTWLALHIGRRNLRRLENSDPPRWSPVHADDWARKPLADKPSARPDADDP